jgi:hypothetical protein
MGFESVFQGLHGKTRSCCQFQVSTSGVQAKTQLLAIAEVLPQVTEIRVFDKEKNAGQRYVDEMRTRIDVTFHLVETVEEATQADIVVTTTPSTVPMTTLPLISEGEPPKRGLINADTCLKMSAAMIISDEVYFRMVYNGAYVLLPRDDDWSGLRQAAQELFEYAQAKDPDTGTRCGWPMPLASAPPVRSL